MVNFQVIKVDSPYNKLLGRPWLHTIGGVMSTLHRRHKFISKNQLITIMAKEPMTIFQETSIPYIDANAFLEASFHSLELVSMIHNASKLKFGWLVTVLMVAKEMFKFSYKLGQSLGAIRRGSPTLIELSDNKGRFSMGYEPTHEELFQASRGNKRNTDTSGMSISHISFIFPALAKVIMPEPFTDWKMKSLIWLALFGSIPKSSP